MSEEQTTQAVVDETKAPAQPGAEATSARIDDGIDSLLNEFDQKTKSTPERTDHPAPAATSDRPVEKEHDEDHLMRLSLAEIRNRVVLESVLEHQLANSERLHQENQARQEREDFEETVEEAARMLEGAAHVGDPKEYARRWLLSEAALNPRLAEAWDHRRDSKEHQVYAVSALKRAFKEMRKAVDRMPDPHATEDRAAVVAAMRGASNRAPPAENSASYERRLSQMNQKEFEAERAKYGM